MIEKKITTMSIRADVLNRAKREIPNLSDFVENCLIMYLNISEADDNVKSMQDELNIIKEARLKIHLLSEVEDNKLDNCLFDKDKQDKVWQKVWRLYRTQETFNDTDLVNASRVLGVTVDSLQSIIKDLVFNVPASDLIGCDEWSVALETFSKI